MAMTFKNAPYFDDFDPANNFYRVLFKPGYAVQARELNQLQSILQHQVTTVGNHLFKKNSMVIPGGVFLKTDADIITITNMDGSVYANPSSLVGKTITNATTIDITDPTSLANKITAVVIAARDSFTSIDSYGNSVINHAALYLSYKNGMTEETLNGSETRRTFDKTKDISVKTYDISPIEVKINSSSIGKVATVAPGTFFTKDIFVDTTKAQHLILEDTNKVLNCTVGLNVVESIVTSDDDETLLDNATGAPNQYAPGADRYKIQLIISRVDGNNVSTSENFIKMMTIENDVITYQNDRTQYNELLKILASRTYDANGNFIVNGLVPSITDTSDVKYLNLNVSKGKAYVGGYEYDQISDVKVSLEKPRKAPYISDTQTKTTHTADCMTYFYIGGNDTSGIGGYITTDISDNGTLVQLTSGRLPTSSAYIIGYGILRGLEYAFSSSDGSTIYKIYLDDVTFNSGYSARDVSSIQSPKSLNDNQVRYFDAPVLHEYTLTDIISNNNSATASSVFQKDNIIVPGGASTDTISLGRIFTTNGNKIYVNKETNRPLPVSTTIKQYTGLTTATFGVSGLAANVGSTMFNYVKPKTVTSTYGSGGVFNFVLDTTTYGSTGYGFNSSILKTFVVSSGTGYADGNTIVISGADLGGTIVTNDLTLTVDFGTQVAATATVSSVFSSNFSPSIIPMIEVDTDIISSIESTSYYTLQYDKFEFINYSPGDTPDPILSGSLNLSSSFTDLTSRNHIAYYTIDEGTGVQEDVVVTLDSSDITDYDSYYSLSLNDSTTIGSKISGITGPINVTIYVYRVIKRSYSSNNLNEQDKGFITKTPTSYNLTIPQPDQSWTALRHQDIYSITKIIEGNTVAVDTATSSLDGSEYSVVITGATGHGLTIGSTADIVVKGIKSTLNVTGEFNLGYNIFTTATVLNTTQLVYVVPNNPGTVTNVTGSVIALPPDFQSSTGDIKSRYNLYSGNDAYMTSCGLIKQKKDAIGPLGQLGVTYKYFKMGDVGSYVSINSYASNNIEDIANVYDHTNKEIPTHRYIDFRIKPSSCYFKNRGSVSGTTLTLQDLNLSAVTNLIGKYIIGPGCEQGREILSVNKNVITLATSTDRPASGIYYVGLKLQNGDFFVADSDLNGRILDFPIVGSTRGIIINYSKYLSRDVLIYIDRANDRDLTNFSIKYTDIDNTFDINSYRQDIYKLPIGKAHLPPYTLNSKDVILTRIENPVYKMTDIHDMNERLTRNEYYTSLALATTPAEEELLDNPGYIDDMWVETFSNLEAQEAQDDDFRCTVYENTYVAPRTHTKVVLLQPDQTYNIGSWSQTGHCITLPYTERKSISNDKASKAEDVNPWDTTPWTGKVKLNPSVDNWVDIPDECRPRGEEVVTKITDLITSGRGCSKNPFGINNHSIAFSWETNWGRKGRVNTDRHLSKVINKLGEPGTNGSYARSCVGKPYNDEKVKAYLLAGSHFDTKPMDQW